MTAEPVSPPHDSISSAHISKTSLLAPTIKLWRLYLEDQGVSIHTIKAFLSDLNLLAAYLPTDRQVGDINTNELNQFLNWLQKGRGVACSPKSLARRITSLKAFFRWLHQYGAIVINPAETIPQKSVISPLPTVLTKEEVERVLAAAEKHRTFPKPDARPITLVALLLQTGIKKGECLSLTLNHLILPEEGISELYVRYSNPRSRFKERKIQLEDSWVGFFNEYVSQYGITDRLFPWSPRRLEYLLEDLSNEAGLEKHLSFDMCRWTSALLDLDRGMEGDKIRQKLGVSKIQWREISMKLTRLAGTE